MNYSDTTPDVTYTYDRLGRQLSAVAADVSTNLYAYSTNTLELVSETQNGVVINRSRDAFGRESGIALEESDYNVSYGYDAYGRFGAVTSDSLLVTNNFTYSYLPGASLVSGMTASTGHAWTRSYEQHRNLITAVTNSFNGNLISAFDYVNDSIGRRTARLDALPGEVAATNAFGYNTHSEVTSANMGTNAYVYVFDPIGNRIAATSNAEVTSYAANELNQYTVISNAVVAFLTHDDDGNMLTNDMLSYTWDGENRLIGVSLNGAAIATYAYDHQSRRIGKTAQGVIRSYLYDGWNLIRESSGTNITHYVWGLDLSGSLKGAGGVGGLLAVVSPLPLGEDMGEGGTVYLSCYDANGNITEYVSTGGATVAHYEYSPFGETIIHSNSLVDFFVFRFSTKYWENEAKIYYYGYRFYTPNVGRCLNRDPIEEEGGMNMFVFVRNDLLDNVDWLGMRKACDAAGFGTPAKSNKCSPCNKGDVKGTWQRKSYNNESNGCGPFAPIFGVIPGGWVPDNPMGRSGCSFSTACDYHDCCYGWCGTTQAECDAGFLASMKATCRGCISIGILFFSPKMYLQELAKCFSLAELYAWAVRQGGDGAHKSSQSDACEECCCN